MTRPSPQRRPALAGAVPPNSARRRLVQARRQLQILFLAALGTAGYFAHEGHRVAALATVVTALTGLTVINILGRRWSDEQE
jgi:hypothetical protein